MSRSDWPNAHSRRPESSAVKSIHDTKAAPYDNNENKFAPAHQQNVKPGAKDDAGTAKINDDAKESPAEFGTTLLAGSD